MRMLIMTEGDLVRRINFPDDLNSDQKIKRLWKEPALVVRGIYEGSVTHYNHNGKPRMTELKPVIDVMIDGRIVKCMPIEFFERVTSSEARQEEEAGVE